jgi:hypothetical protein
VISDEPVKLRFTHHFSLVTLEYQTGSSQPLPFVGIRSGQYILNPFCLDAVAKGEPLIHGERVGDILTGMSPLLNASEKIPGITFYQAIVVPQTLGGESLFYTLKNKENQFSSINTQNAFTGFVRGKAYRFSELKN